MSKMSREIKFRAWNFRTKEMFSAKTLAEDQLTLLTTGQFINVHPNPGLSIVYPLESMIPLQFTGLLDKNKQPIFEGDIVLEPHSGFEPRNKYIVVWNETDYRFSLMLKHELYGTHERHFKDAFQMEIIGNIYENPELLK